MNLRTRIFKIMTPIVLIVGASLSLIFTACEKQEPSKDVIAEVGKAKLTLSDLQERFPPEYKDIITREQYLDYVQRWMDEEFIHQEALNEKLDHDKEIQKDINEQKKKILVEAYLNLKKSESGYNPDDATIKQYFELHRKDFLRTEKEIKILTIEFFDLKTALSARQNLNPDNFTKVMQKQRAQDSPHEENLNTDYKTFNELDACIADEVFSTRIGGITQIMECAGKYIVAFVIDKQMPGTEQSLEAATEKVRNILVQGWNKKQLDDKISEIKASMYFNVNLSLIPGN